MMYGGVIVMVGLSAEVSLSAREVSASVSTCLSLSWWALGGVPLGAEGLGQSFAAGSPDGASPDGGSTD
jgi:hypothetical protein